MPAYDYRCERGHRYERREPFGSPTTHACEKCGRPAQRVLNAPAIAFKGDGWYKTDSRSDVRSEHKKESTSAPSSDSKSSDSSSAEKSGKATSKSKQAAADQ